MNNQTVWLLCEEGYELEILGIFSSVENAKIWFKQYCKQRVEKEAEIYPENLLRDWTKATPWKPDGNKVVSWHCTLPPTDPNFFEYAWTIVPYTVDVP